MKMISRSFIKNSTYRS